MKIKIEYGTKNNKIDVTDKLINYTIIPKNDIHKIIGIDPVPNVIKSIFINNKEYCTKNIIKLPNIIINICSEYIHPISFSIPTEKIYYNYKNIVKTKLLSSLIPGDRTTYIYNNEEDYYNEYKKSYFAITKKKSGWDCLRHYEIICNGCLPYFIDIEKCPTNTMFLHPKKLYIESNNLYDEIKNININNLTNKQINTYNKLRVQIIKYTLNKLTTEKMALYIINKTNNNNNKNISKILFLSGNTKPDYLRCLTLHGFKKIFGTNCHDYPKISHIYKLNNLNYNLLYGKGITYTNLLNNNLHNNKLDYSIVQDIKNKYYDIIIYGSYHRGMPYYDLVCNNYDSSKIILLCGEDIHSCDYYKYIAKGHHVFVRELI